MDLYIINVALLARNRFSLVGINTLWGTVLITFDMCCLNDTIWFLPVLDLSPLSY